MDRKECCWVLRTLWSPGGLFYAKVKVLDTLLSDSESRSGFRWLFTDQSGQVRKHTDQRMTTEQIIKSFISKSVASTGLPPVVQSQLLSARPRERHSSDDLFIATLISGDTFEVLSRQKAISLISQRSIGLNAALQLFLYPYKDMSLRYQLTVKAAEGRVLYTFERTWLGKDPPRNEPIQSVEICSSMRACEKEVRTVIERTTGQRVVELCLLFLLDKSRSLWLIGSKTCTLTSPESFYQALSPPNSPKYSPQQSIVSHHLHSSLSLGSFTSSVHQPTHASLGHSSKLFPVHTASTRSSHCPGDFCNFVLCELTELQRGEVDYDDLIKVIRTAYSSDGQQGAMNIKMTLATDFLSNEREKLKPKNVTYCVGNRYLTLGRQLLSRSGWKENFAPGDQLEIDLKPLLKLHGRLYLPDSDISDIEKAGQTQPFAYYTSVKVCGRCYPIYMTIRQAHKQALKSHFLTTQNSPNISRREKRLLSVGKTTERDTIVTSLGKINKNSINDLLVDLRFAQEEEKQQSPAVKLHLSGLYRNLTESEIRRKAEIMKKTEKEQAERIETRKIEGFSLGKDITLRLFPAENTKLLQVTDQATKNTAKWRQFIEKHRHIRAKTPSK